VRGGDFFIRDRTPRMSWCANGFIDEKF